MALFQAINRLERARRGPIWVHGTHSRFTLRIKAMRFDKLTTKLQEALGEAQSLALGRDQQYIEPAHLLLALLDQDDAGISGLISKAGGNASLLRKNVSNSIEKLP